MTALKPMDYRSVLKPNSSSGAPLAEYTAMQEDTMSPGKSNGVAPQDSGKTYVESPSPRTEAGGEGVEEEEDSPPCSWGPLKPDCCQRFRRPHFFLVWLCMAGAIQGMVVNGFINVVISNIERRFEISSTESGTIASCYDIASVLCLIPVSYFGGLGRKPRYLGIGVFVMGVGSLVFALPHFTSPKYSIGTTGATLCRPGSNSTAACESGDSGISNYKYVFFLGQLLHGAGASPLYTLGPTYMDENVPFRSSSFYNGIFYALAIVGPAIGYIAGGAFLDIYTDPGEDSANKITSDNPRWVGAWWIGFLLSAFLAFCVAFPLCGFPKVLPGSSKYKAERGKEAHYGKRHWSGEKSQGLKDIIRSTKALLTNPTFMFLNCAAATEGLQLSGFSTFVTKFVEFQFSMSSSRAALYVGCAVVPAGAGGMLLGGYLVKRFNWTLSSILKFGGIVSACTLCFALVFLAHCSSVPFAGVTLGYGADPAASPLDFLDGRFNSTCNRGCDCSLSDYRPVCGLDEVMYYSPCYAGCLDSINADTKSGVKGTSNSTQNMREHGTHQAPGKSNVTTFTNCSCVGSWSSNSSIQRHATDGKCPSGCPYLPLFMPVLTMVILLIFVTSMPALTATLRCIPVNRQAYGLGIQWIIARLCGSIPGPILFGNVIDMTCILWQSTCNGQGSCFFYNNQRQAYYLLALLVVLKALSAIFFFLSWKFYHPPPPSSLITTDPIPESDDAGTRTGGSLGKDRVETKDHEKNGTGLGGEGSGIKDEKHAEIVVNGGISNNATDEHIISHL